MPYRIAHRDGLATPRTWRSVQPVAVAGAGLPPQGGPDLGHVSWLNFKTNHSRRGGRHSLEQRSPHVFPAEKKKEPITRAHWVRHLQLELIFGIDILLDLDVPSCNRGPHFFPSWLGTNWQLNLRSVEATARMLGEIVWKTSLPIVSLGGQS